MKKKPNYRDDLFERLRNPKYAVGFLNEALKDDDKTVFLLALRDVVEAHGGMTKISRLTKISREHFYRALSAKGNPEFDTLKSVLDALGFTIWIGKKSPSRKAA